MSQLSSKVVVASTNLLKSKGWQYQTMVKFIKEKKLVTPILSTCMSKLP